MMTAEATTIARGEKMAESRPMTGAQLEKATRNTVVIHMASSYASRSSAIRDWAMVMPLILDADGSRRVGVSEVASTTYSDQTVSRREPGGVIEPCKKIKR